MIKKIIKRLFRYCGQTITGIFWYTRDLWSYKRLQKKSPAAAPAFYLFPKVYDKSALSHTFDKHYVYMDRWAFKNLLERRPEQHVDVGSSIRFLSMASSVCKLKFVDIRAIKVDFDNFEFIEGSILKMPFTDNSVKSLSCLHVAEHIGLGRYGDPLDPEGTNKACAELARVLEPGGSLYFALPVGKQAVYFNAHRVHNPKTILDYFPDLKLQGFSAVNDAGNFIQNARMDDYANSVYACGMFKFSK